MPFPSNLVFTAILFAALPLRAQVTALQDDAPLNAKTLAEQVSAFAKARELKKVEFLERTRQDLAKPILASGAAGNYVLDCMRKVEYEGKDGGNAQFTEWKKKNRGMFSDRNFERASDLYLRYLALTLRRATLKTAEPVQPEILAYLELLNSQKDLVANVMRDDNQIKMTVYDQKEGKVTGQIIGSIEDTKLASAQNARTFVQDLLNQNVNAGLVAQALKLEGLLDQIPDWEMRPGDFAGILDKNVRPVLREKKDPKLLATWDYEISFTAAVVDLKHNERDKEKFRRETYPRLIWKKAADAELLGLKNRALNIRLDIAQKYPEHPDFDAWSKQIETALATLKKDVPAAPSPEGGVAPIQPMPEEGEGSVASPDEAPFGTKENPETALAPTPAAPEP